jgi:hypothetical protein
MIVVKENKNEAFLSEPTTPNYGKDPDIHEELQITFRSKITIFK